MAREMKTYKINLGVGVDSVNFMGQPICCSIREEHILASEVLVCPSGVVIFYDENGGLKRAFASGQWQEIECGSETIRP